jgi:Ca2+-binding EF-hand superfamily protein
MSPDEQKVMVHDTHSVLFDAIDTNKDGHICLEEFKTYFFVIAPETSEADVIRSFNAIDVNRNRKISRKEFLAAAEDFLTGVEETHVSNVFFGRSLDEI